MNDGDSGSAGAPGNILGEAKAQAIGDVVRCRETTNQRILSLYEKMYDDLRPVECKKLDILERISFIEVGENGDKKVFF